MGPRRDAAGCTQRGCCIRKGDVTRRKRLAAQAHAPPQTNECTTDTPYSSIHHSTDSGSLPTSPRSPKMRRLWSPPELLQDWEDEQGDRSATWTEARSKECRWDRGPVIAAEARRRLLGPPPAAWPAAAHRVGGRTPARAAAHDALRARVIHYRLGALRADVEAQVQRRHGWLAGGGLCGCAGRLRRAVTQAARCTRSPEVLMSGPLWLAPGARALPLTVYDVFKTLAFSAGQWQEHAQ